MQLRVLFSEAHRDRYRDHNNTESQCAAPSESRHQTKRIYCHKNHKITKPLRLEETSVIPTPAHPLTATPKRTIRFGKDLQDPQPTHTVPLNSTSPQFIAPLWLGTPPQNTKSLPYLMFYPLYFTILFSLKALVLIHHKGYCVPYTFHPKPRPSASQTSLLYPSH